jgi:hypothetical protein
MTIEDLKGEISQWKITRHRILDLAIGACTMVLHEFIAKPYYRPFIYSHDIYDFHIADTLGNSLGTITAVFIVVGLFGRDKTRDYFLIKMTTISFIIYELAQPLLGKPIDPWDIIATVLTGGLCFLLYRVMHQSKMRPTDTENKK